MLNTTNVKSIYWCTERVKDTFIPCGHSFCAPCLYHIKEDPTQETRYPSCRVEYNSEEESKGKMGGLMVWKSLFQNTCSTKIGRMINCSCYDTTFQTNQPCPFWISRKTIRAAIRMRLKERTGLRNQQLFIHLWPITTVRMTLAQKSLPKV